MKLFQFENLDLGHINKLKKYYINDITQKTVAVTNQIRRTSLNAINMVKNMKINIENFKLLNFLLYDTKRISFLVQQASYIDQKIDETPEEKAKKLETLLQQSQNIIGNQKDELEKLSNIIKLNDITIINQENETNKLLSLFNEKENLLETQKKEAENLCNFVNQKEIIIASQKNEIDDFFSQLKQKEILLENQKKEIEELSRIMKLQENCIKSQMSAKPYQIFAKGYDGNNNMLTINPECTVSQLIQMINRETCYKISDFIYNCRIFDTARDGNYNLWQLGIICNSTIHLRLLLKG